MTAWNVDGPGVTNRSGGPTVGEVYCQHLVLTGAWRYKGPPPSCAFIDWCRHAWVHTGDFPPDGGRRTDGRKSISSRQICPGTRSIWPKNWSYKGFKQLKWPLGSFKVTGIGTICWLYDFLLVIHCICKYISLSCTVSEILTLTWKNFKRSRDLKHAYVCESLSS